LTEASTDLFFLLFVFFSSFCFSDSDILFCFIFILETH
jgi:hypothetical protein